MDIQMRRVFLEEWIEELQRTRSLIAHFDVSGTGLTSVHREVLAQLEQTIRFAESKQLGYHPMASLHVVGR